MVTVEDVENTIYDARLRSTKGCSTAEGRQSYVSQKDRIIA
jgi:hypothetical protein